MVCLSFSTPKLHLGGRLDVFSSSPSDSLLGEFVSLAFRLPKNGKRDMGEVWVSSWVAMVKPGSEDRAADSTVVKFRRARCLMRGGAAVRRPAPST